MKNQDKFQKELLKWYDRNKRDLPFRHTKDPYKIWLSEIMLQQTTMGAALDYYHRFLQQFPTLLSVAKASEDSLLTIWQGLGYYSRVRNFQKACQQVLDDHGGKVPQEFSELKTLKGVGDYTAAAVASICFNKAHAAIDGNVKRVISRLEHYTKNIQTPQATRYFHQKANDFLNKKRPGDFNQAMMELGALVCTKTPKCLLCPVRDFCQSHTRDPQKLPVKNKTAYTSVSYTSLLICSQNKVLLRPPHKNSLIRNMWELPGHYQKQKQAGLKDLENVTGFKISPHKIEDCGTVKHGIMNQRITTQVYGLKTSTPQLTKLKRDGFKWVDADGLKSLPINTLSRKVLRAYFLPHRKG